MHENYEGYEGRHDWPAARVFKYIFAGIAGVFLACVFGFLFGWLVMWLWNWLMPGLFGWKVITFWQAFGIIVLARLVFGCGGGRGHHHGPHGRWKHKPWKHGHGSWRDEWAPKGDYRNWKYYEDYWHDEGKAAYEAYIDRMKAQKKEGE